MRSLAGYLLFVGFLCCAVVEGGSAAEVAEKTEVVHVAVFHDTGVGRSIKQVTDALDEFADLEYEEITAGDIREGKLSKYDVVLHPGGSGSNQGEALEEIGREQVREFVESGGGYVGICAGSYLASSNYSWSLHILDAKVVDRAHWARGSGDVTIRLSEAGQKLLECDKDLETILYYQGPLLAPAEKPNVPDYEPLATFESEIAKNGAPKGVMKGTTAIAAGTFGKGRVLCFSPHPEKTEGLERFVRLAIRWAAGEGD